MELDALISEILSRVQEKVAALDAQPEEVIPETEETKTACDSDKAKLLVLAQEHGLICHPTYESKELAECYQVDCALLKEDGYSIENYEGVIAYTLTNEALGKLANGIFDSAYTRAFGTALLLGRPVFVPEEEVELYRYKDTAPKGYYHCLEEKLEFLKNNGVTIVPNARLIPTILGEACQAEDKPESKPCPKEERRECVLTIDKKVITERDLINAKTAKATCVHVIAKAIVTDLAKDYARKNGIAIQKEEA